MPQVHPTSTLDGDIDLADDVVIGPRCSLTGRMTIGGGSHVVGDVWLTGPLEIGERNIVYPFACIGFAPQHVKFDPNTDGRGTHIGDDNTFREHCTVHRAFADDGPTMIGNHNLFMVNAHVAHDCHIGDHNTMVNNTALGGHVHVSERVTVGGGTVVHQHCHLGEGAMLGGGLVARNSIPPWFMLTDVDTCGGLNLIGMRRNGFTSEEIKTARWVFGVLMREGLAWSRALQRLAERADEPLVGKYLDFFAQSNRPIAQGTAGAARSESL